MKPVIAVLWILSIALAVGLTRLADPGQGGSEPSPSFAEAFAEFNPLRRSPAVLAGNLPTGAAATKPSA